MSAPAPAAASASSAPAVKKTKAQMYQEERDRNAYEDQRIAALQEMEATPSEAESLAERIKEIDLKYDPENHFHDFDLDSGIEIEGMTELKELKHAFRQLDAKYSELAVKEWLLRQAYHQKHRQVSTRADCLHCCRCYYYSDAYYDCSIAFYVVDVQTKAVAADADKAKKEVVAVKKVAEDLANEAQQANKHKGCGCKTDCASPICGCRRQQLPCWWAAGKDGKASGCKGCTKETCLNPLSWLDNEEDFMKVKRNYAKKMIARKMEQAMDM